MKVSKAPEVLQPRYREGIFSAVSAGFVFLLAGMMFVAVPNLFEKILAFFQDFDVVNVPNTNIFIPAPTHPSRHLVFYSAVIQFSLILGLFEIAILVLRFFVRSPLSKKAETASNVVFWLGASYLINTFLNEMATATTWFVFWSTILMLIGFSLIVRAIILATIKMKLS